MSLLTLDFETYYADDYSLSRMTTEEYINDPRFETIGVSVSIDGGEPSWFSGTHEQIKDYLNIFDWSQSALVAQNASFDAAILAWRFGIIPAFIYDTMSMAKALSSPMQSVGLEALASRFKVGVKGTEVVNAKNKRRADFTPRELAAYGEYCDNDVVLTYKLWEIFAGQLTESEHELIDMTIRMFTEPTFTVDVDMLEGRLKEIRDEKSEMLSQLMAGLHCATEEDVRKQLASNPKFAKLLESLGVPAPMKTSKTTGKETFAFAKNDPEFMALLEHENPLVQQLCSVRVGTKSTIEESRIVRFIGIAERNMGKIPIPLRYYGAHTGRWAGEEKINMQNLPSRDARKKALKNAIKAPPGYYVVNSDSSQIEARVLAYLAGQDDLVKVFAEGGDPYCLFASKVYNKTITKEYPIERFVGKTCLVGETLVLCANGWKQIRDVSPNDRVWDGEEWVDQSGVMSNGLQPTVRLCGVSLTPDHLVWSGTQWWEAGSLLNDSNNLYQSLAIAAANLPSQVTSLGPEGSKPLLFDAGVGGPNTRLTATTSRTSKVLDALFAPVKQLVKNDIGFTPKPCLMMSLGHGYLTASLPQSQDAIQKQASTTYTTDNVASQYTKNGGTIGQHFLNTCRRLKDGTIQRLRWIGLIPMAATNPATSGLSPVVQTYSTKEKSQTSKQNLQVYDLINCGPRNRFTILTDRGPLIVHNCILGLGFGTGWKKLQDTLKTTPPYALLSDDECQSAVNIYRTENDKIPDLWNEADRALQDMISWPYPKSPWYLGKHKLILVTPEGLKLPNGLYIRYTNLRRSRDGIVHDTRKGITGIWGGGVVENVVQALARLIVSGQMLDIRAQGYKIALTVHDSAVPVVPRTTVDEDVKKIKAIMSTAPSWTPGLPVACEAKYAASYGEC